MALSDGRLQRPPWPSATEKETRRTDSGGHTSVHVVQSAGEEALEPAIGIGYGRHRGSVDEPATLTPRPDQATRLQDAEVVRDCLTRHAQRLLQLRCTHVAPAKQLQHTQPRIRGKRSYNLDDIFHTYLINGAAVLR